MRVGLKAKEQALLRLVCLHWCHPRVYLTLRERCAFGQIWSHTVPCKLTPSLEVDWEIKWSIAIFTGISQPKPGQTAILILSISCWEYSQNHNVNSGQTEFQSYKFQSYNSGSGNRCLAYLHNYLSLIKQPDVFLPQTDIRQKPYWNPGIVMVWIMATRLMSEDVCSGVQSSFNIKWRFTIPPTLPSIKSSANKKMNIKSPLEEGT